MFKNLILSGIMISTMLTANGGFSVNTPVALITNNKEVHEQYKTPDYLHVANAALYKGKISKINITKNGIDILILNDSGKTYDSLIFHVDKDTKINVDKESLKAGDTLDVFYSGAITRSLPGQATAIAVNLVTQAKQSFTYEGEINNIVEIKGNKMVSVATKNKDSNFEEITFNVSSDAKFIGGTISNLKKGNTVKIEYGPVMTLSLPPMTSALSIEILK